VRRDRTATSRATSLLLLAPAKVRVRQSDAGVALAAGGDSDNGRPEVIAHEKSGTLQVITKLCGLCSARVCPQGQRCPKST